MRTGDFAGIIEDRGRHATKAILEAKERLTDDVLSSADADALRAVIVDQVGGLYRLAAQLVRNLDGQLGRSANVNQLWLEAIAAELGVEAPEVLVASGNGHAGPA